MIRAVEATIDETGNVHLQEEVTLASIRRAVVMILDEPPTGNVKVVSETALLSEATLSQDWDRPEEDEAWSHLKPAMSS